MAQTKNPVLGGFQPDPSVVYAEGVFYIVNSTFEYYPGISLMRSRDLSNWERLPSPLRHDFSGLGASSGVWAPNITFDNGIFYIAFSIAHNTDGGSFIDVRNYVITAKDANGPWSTPVFINGSGFDPSLYHEGGRLWFVNMEWDFRESGVERFAGILLTELDKETLAPKSKPEKILETGVLGLTEAPNIYKINGLYYLFTAEGGTNYGHAETVFRAESLYGPYEPSPRNPLISSRENPDWPLQKAGHASLFQGPDDRWFVAFLCSRQLPGTKCSVLGRETAFAEVEISEDGWFTLKCDNAPLPPLEFMSYGECRCDNNFLCNFSELSLPNDVLFLRSPTRYELGDGVLRLYGGRAPVSRFGQQALLIRQRHFAFTLETRVSFSPSSYTEAAGIIYRYDERNQFLLALTCNDAGERVLKVISFDAGVCAFSCELLFDGCEVYLRLIVDNGEGTFWYSADGKEYARFPKPLDVSILCDEYDEYGFTGAAIGLFCMDTRYEASHADFSYLSYKGED